MRVGLLILCIVLCFAASAEAKQPNTKHDRDVIRFFLKHPKLAMTPAGQREMWKVLDHLSTSLRALQSSRTIQEPADWLTAVKVVQRFYPGSEAWIRSCSQNGSEGGWGRWVWNTQGSQAGGWMQYMEGTFWGDFNASVKHLATLRVKVPKSAWSWRSPLGQALAAGWAHNYGTYTGGKWTGWGC